MKYKLFFIFLISIVFLSSQNKSKEITKNIERYNIKNDLNNKYTQDLQNPLQQKKYKIGILQMVKSLDNAVEGFKDGMKELGYIEGKNIEYEYKNANAVSGKIIEYGEYFINSNKDLIFCCSTPVTKNLAFVRRGYRHPLSG